MSANRSKDASAKSYPGSQWQPAVDQQTRRGGRAIVLADAPCEAGFSGAGPEYAGIYLHARYFDPKLGTFLSPDPIGVAGGLNQYGYALGNPVNGTDRSGLLLDAGLWCFQIVVQDHWTTICLPTTGGGGGGTTSGGSGTNNDGRGGKGHEEQKEEQNKGPEKPPENPKPKEDPKRTPRSPDGTCQVETVADRWWDNMSMTTGGLLTGGAEAFAGGDRASAAVMLGTDAGLAAAGFGVRMAIAGELARQGGMSTLLGAIETFVVGSPNLTITAGSSASAALFGEGVAVSAGAAGLSIPAFYGGTSIGAWLEAIGPYADKALSSPVNMAIYSAMPRCK